MAVDLRDDTEVEIIKARTDEREYRRIVLDNSLEVLLISDLDTDKCAASMNVAVGSFSDPEGLCGLAHFLEHMLFFSSEKYPEEGSYSKYISEHGGSTNAYTSQEDTNFYFDINPDSFEDALDRFSQFFIQPLISPDATIREIKAVDSEYQNNLLSDGHRMNQLQRYLSRKGHPYHRFTTGNWNTLMVEPEEKGVDTRKELIEFYDVQYSSNIMNLVVYGKENLDAMQNLVAQKFEKIRNIKKDFSSLAEQPCMSEHLQILVKAVPITEGHTLTMEWPVTPNHQSYKEIPNSYISHLIDHEGEGSLFHVLKTLGWATGLYTSANEWRSKFSFFEVEINLTDAGHEHMQEIVGLVFKYIQLLQQSGICKWTFDEVSDIYEMVFHYQDKIPPIDYVESIASNMQLYPPKDWLVGSSLPSRFNPDVIQMLLNELSLHHVRIFWWSKKFEGHTDMVEPWYNTAYSVEKITNTTIKEWMENAPNVELHLPVPNIFIPTDFSLKAAQKKVEVPVLLRRSTYTELWYKPDTKFLKPKAHVAINFNCALGHYSPETVPLSSLFVSLLVDYLNEYAYYAEVAGLSYGISLTNSGFEVSVAGYDHKLRILLETILQKTANFEVKLDRFSVIKETTLKDYQNIKFQQPCDQAEDYCSLILYDRTWPWTEQLETLTHLEADDLTRFAQKFLSRASIECYIAGNIDRDEAESIVEHIEDVFYKGGNPVCRPLLPSQYPVNRTIELQKGMRYYFHREGLNREDENSAIIHYIQVHQDDPIMNVKLQLLILVAQQPAFHQLRTVEQLGYMVFLNLRNDSNVYGLEFTIQSSVKGPMHIDSRIESFLEDIERKLHEITDEEFKSNVKTLIDMKLEKPKNLYEDFQFYWSEIQAGTLKFNRIEIEVTALKLLKKQDLIDFFNDYVRVDAPKKRSLSICVYGKHHMSEYSSDVKRELLTQAVRIEDVFSFRRSRPLFPSLFGSGKMKI